MSLGVALKTATTGLQAAQASLRAVSDNIANVNTPGYVRKAVNQEQQVDGFADVTWGVDGFADVTWGVDVGDVVRHRPQLGLRGLQTRCGCLECDADRHGSGLRPARVVVRPGDFCRDQGERDDVGLRNLQ